MDYCQLKDELIKIGYELTIHVINDGSTDDTKNIAEKFEKVLVITHKKNMGLGAAVRTGLLSADRIGADILVKYDADLQHEPNDIISLIKPINEDEADIVYGNRFKKLIIKCQ